jgi:hypothetical protein
MQLIGQPVQWAIGFFGIRLMLLREIAEPLIVRHDALQCPLRSLIGLIVPI